MYEYIIILIKIYPYFYYFNNLYEYFNFARTVCGIITSSYYKFFGSRKIKKKQEIDEIYEIIEQTTPFGENISYIDDTNYKTFYDRNETLDERWFSI